MLLIAAGLGIAIGLIVFFFVPGQKKADQVQGKTDSPRTAAHEGGRKAASQQPGPGRDKTASTEQPPAHPETNRPSGMPLITLPSAPGSLDLDTIPLPPLPYCIYTDGYKNFKEAATTLSELDSNYLTAYIVPMAIKGNVAQSLFGVTQDGLWYLVLTGHFPSRKEARKTLAFMMKELPGYQPEILGFPYALECGRFLAPEKARKLSDKLDRKGVFHYTQDYPTTSGKTLTRILVGCYFSEQGASARVGRLREKGFDCRVVKR